MNIAVVIARDVVMQVQLVNYDQTKLIYTERQVVQPEFQERRAYEFLHAPPETHIYKNKMT
jgi:hypothetical protein